LPANTSSTVDDPLSPQLAPEVKTKLSTLSADPDLTRLVAAWPDLPAHIKAAVLALLDASR
jgi:hypothetical protein